MVGTFDDIGEVAWDHSVLEFDEAHKRGLAVLQRFFALGVEWPRTVPLIRRLMKLPDNPLFLAAEQGVEGLGHQEPGASDQAQPARGGRNGLALYADQIVGASRVHAPQTMAA